MNQFLSLGAVPDPARLFELFTKIRRVTSPSATRLGDSTTTDGSAAREIYRLAGLESVGHDVYRELVDPSTSTATYLSHSDVDSDAISARPLAWLNPASRADGLRRMLRINALLPAGGLALAKLENKELVIFIDHLPTAHLDASELQTTLLASRLAAVHCGIEAARNESWFDRTKTNSVHAEIERHLFARGTGWMRAPVPKDELPSWVRAGDAPIIAQFDRHNGLLTVAREIDSFVGRPRLEVAERMLAANLTLLDCTVASLQLGERGMFAALGRICCDNLDQPELERLISYLERIRPTGTARRTSDDLMAIMEAHRVVRPEVSSTESVESTGGQPEWPDSIELGTRPDDTALSIPVTDLLTHTFVCGASGSGKTVVCKNLIEEAAVSGVPSLVIDLKGDLSSLACVPSGTSRDDVSEYLVRLYGENAPIASDEIARHTERMTSGYERQGINDESLKAFRDRVRYRILTPRSDRGIPVSLSPLERLDLGSVDATAGVIGNQELHETLESTLSSLVQHLQLTETDTETLVAVLIQLLESAHRRNLPLKGIDGIRTLVRLLFEIHEHTQEVNFLPTEWAIDERQAHRYARAMNARLGGSFRYWFDGHDFSVDDLINVEDGRVPINIVNLSLLQSQSDQAYAIAQINSRIVSWMRRQPGSQRPRLIYYIDEIAQSGGNGAIFPPHPYNPITKPGLTTLLKQGRAFGVSCLLATQNAKDIDYKGLGQCDTWVVGKIKTETDLDRLRLGLESADLGTVEGAGQQLDEGVREVAGLDTGEFIIRTRSQGVTRYKQKWIRTFHERLSGEMLSNWLRATEIPIERRIDEVHELWNERQPMRAIELLQGIVADEPYFSRLAEAKLLLCEWLFRTEQWQRVAENAADLRGMVQSRSGFERVHYFEGMSLYQCNELDQAKAALQRFLASGTSGDGEFGERCREVLESLQIQQDDYEGLEQTVTEQSRVSEAAPGRLDRILAFCRMMRAALKSWPGLRGKLDDAHVISESRDDRVRYTTKKDADVHEYVARIHERIGELPTYSFPLSWTDAERAGMERVHATLAVDDAVRRGQERELQAILAQAESRLGCGEFADASADLDVARRLVLQTGLSKDEFERVLSLYRGHFSQKRESLRDWLQNMDPIEFELETASLFRRLGYEAQATKASGDGGVDVFARYENRKYVVQCKRYKHAISPNLIREFATVIRNFDADHGIFVTTSSFTEGCRDEARLHDIRLIDLDELLRLYGEQHTVEASPTSARSISPADDPNLDAAIGAVLEILELAESPLLATAVADQANLELRECQRALRSLIERDLVQKQGRTRGMRYFLATAA